MRKVLLAVLLICFAYKHLHASSGFEQYGDIGQFALPVAAFLTTVVHRDMPGSIQFLQAYGAALGTAQAVKHVVNAQRPNGGTKSFPSGHTASAFAGAAFIQRRYGWNYGVFAYAAASAVGISRIDANKHWARDVVAGAAIGILSNLVFTKPYRTCSIGFMPCYGENGLGMTAQLTVKLRATHP